MTALIIIFFCLLWLCLGWMALDGYLKIENEYLWLVCFGVPVVIILGTAILIDTIGNRRYR